MAVVAFQEGRTLHIVVKGRFDFQTHSEFRHAYHPDVMGVSDVVVDLSDTEYLDSSALGMLLVLRKEAAKVNAAVSLKGASPTVGRILQIANFSTFFKIAS